MKKQISLTEKIDRSSDKTARYIDNITHSLRSKFGIILGTGLSDATLENSERLYQIPYYEIPNFKSTKIKSHQGEMVFVKIAGKNAVVLSGRYHLYEGHSMQDVVFPIHVLKKLGIENLIVASAVGGINFKPGDLVMLKDHLNFLQESPLIGYSRDDIFIDCLNMYENKLSEIALQVAEEKGIKLKRGVMGFFRGGPQFETRTELRYFKNAGCDTIGWSTVPEAILAHYLKMKVLAINCVTDDQNPKTVKETNLEEIINVAKRENKDLYTIIFNLIKKF